MCVRASGRASAVLHLSGRVEKWGKAGLFAEQWKQMCIRDSYNTDSDGYECPPTEEQYIRSAQFGLLSPLSRCHGKTPREPWYFSQQAQEIFRAYDLSLIHI